MNKTLIVLLVALASSGMALDVDVSGSNVLETRVEKIDFVTNPDSSEASVVDHMLFDVLIGNNFTLGSEVDVRLPRRSKFSGLEEYSTSILDQFHFIYRDDISNITAGHYSATLGKGLSLRAYRDDDLEYDHTLTGAYGRVMPIEMIDFGMLAGQHLRSDEGLFQPDNVQGAEIIVRPIKYIYAGGTVGNERRFNSATNNHDNILIPGGYLGVTLWKFMLYGEVTEPDWMVTSLDPVSLALVKTHEIGHGQYGNLQFNYPGIGVSIQYKDYLKENGDYTSPPPCTHTGTSVNEGADEKGYMGEVTLSPLEGLQAYGGYAKGDGQAEYLDPITQVVTMMPSNLTEYWGGGQYMGIPDLTLNVDYVHSLPHDTIIPDTWVEEGQDIPSVSADLVVAQIHTVSAGVAYEMRRDRNQSIDALTGDILFNDDKYYYLRPSLGYSYNSRVYVTFDFEKTNHEAVVAAGQPPAKTQWLFGQARYVITDQHSITVGYGTRRGGKICSGGMCRVEAPFDGLKINLTSSF
jgi:hypothetical protein